MMAGRSISEITLDDIRKMSLLDGFFNETLRFKTPVRGLLVRRVLEGFHLGSERINKGTKSYIIKVT